MHHIITAEFGIVPLEIKKLHGYDNANYLVITASRNYIFKTYAFQQELFDLIIAENEALVFLHENNTDQYPKPIPFLDHSFVKIIEFKGEQVICRMLSFLEGTFFGDAHKTEKLYKSLGAFLAEINIKLQNYSNYAIKSRVWEWDIQYFSLNKKYLEDIANAKDRNLVAYFFQQFETWVTPQLPSLRKQVIHNDANEWNVLVKNGKISGIIDFGDIAYSPLINELAIAITYACYDKENPLYWASIIVKSYHEKLALEEKEISILYYLIAARLCTSVCNAAHHSKVNPENTYANISEELAWKMLYRWISISPIKAKNTFRSAIGLPIEKQYSIKESIAKRQQHIPPIVSLSYKEPIAMQSAAFQYMFDVNGNKFLDAYNNIPHVGHCHPKIVSATKQQMAKLNTNTRYLYDELALYASKLLAKFPSSLNKVYFVNSGSAASDLAIRIAKIHTQKEMLMVMEHGYHGHTQTTIDISDYKFNNPKGQGQKEHILKTEIPDTYRGKHTQNDGSAGKKYATTAISQIENSDKSIAAFISEPIVGCGGQIPLAKGYLKEIYPAVRKQGGVCISDEVQTGFGRLGDYFWGFEAHDVVPDIVVLGKPIGNGHPIGAVITTSSIADSFGKGVEFFSSFGGNPVSCTIGLAVLETIEEEQLQQNAKLVGDYYKSLFVALQKKYSCIGDVRGNGLFLGIDMVEKNSKNPDTKLAHHIKNELRHQNILISTDGPFDNVIKTKPPLCFTKENAKQVVCAIEEILTYYYS